MKANRTVLERLGFRHGVNERVLQAGEREQMRTIVVTSVGMGEGKTSLTTKVAIDADAKTLALEGYAAAPAWLEVTR